MEFILQPVLHMSVPWLRDVGLGPEVLDRIASAEFQGDEVIDLVFPRRASGDAVFGVDLVFHRLRDVTNFLRIARREDVFFCHVQCGAGSELGIWADGGICQKQVGEQEKGDEDRDRFGHAGIEVGDLSSPVQASEMITARLPKRTLPSGRPFERI